MVGGRYFQHKFGFQRLISNRETPVPPRDSTSPSRHFPLSMANHADHARRVQHSLSRIQGPVVSLGDAALSHADLALLVPPAWLNDNLISFWVEHLRLHVLKDDNRVGVLPPNISYFLALCQDDQDAGTLLKDLNLKQYDLVLVTVNDATAIEFDSSAGRERGSHWSLVVYEKGNHEGGTFFYLDSMPCEANRKVAAKLVAKLRRLLGLDGSGFVNVVVPVQDNVYDCGAYVCMFAEHVIHNYKKGNSTSILYKCIRPPSSDDVGNLRQEIGKLACRILDEKQRSDAATKTKDQK